MFEAFSLWPDPLAYLPGLRPLLGTAAPPSDSCPADRCGPAIRDSGGKDVNPPEVTAGMLPVQ